MAGHVGPDTEYPRLRHCTFKWQSDSEPMTMIVGREHFELSEDDGDRNTFLNVKRYFDGRHPVTQIAEITGVSEDSVRAIVEQFSALGLLRTVESMDVIPADVFAKQIDESCDMWARQIGFHRLFSGIQNGELRKEVFLGLILETYHYVKSASKHIATAIAHCNNPAFAPILSQYFVDEWNHGPLILRALVNMGLPQEWVEEAHPIIGTWSIVNNLCEIARQDTLSYLACTTLFEAKDDDFASAADNLRRTAAAHGYPADSMEPILQHAQIDIESGHVGLLQEALRNVAVVPAEQAHRAVNNLHDMKHSYDQLHDQIIQYYSDIANYIPRVKVDYFSL
jgi:pyrroloquinoline quinone (PQQ) biosynthesis protein C